MENLAPPRHRIHHPHPTDQLTSLAGRREAPEQLAQRFFLAEREGFEPSDPCGSPVFKTGAFSRSATARPAS